MIRPAAVFALTLVTSQPSVQTLTETTPAGRAHHSIFYDDASGRVMLTGGATNFGRRYVLHNDLWSFDGTRWTALPSSGEKMSGMRVTVGAQGRPYSYGGFRDDASVSDFRVMENQRWRLLGTQPPVAAAEPGFVFDAGRNRFVVFGGGAGAGRTMGDVWEFDGMRWVKSSAPAPAARGSHVMVYDSRRRKTVVFGGMGVRSAGGPPPMLGDTWEFDGEKWTRLQVTGPSARLGSGSTYDSKRGLVLVFGGADHDGVFNDLWAWNGTSWRKLAANGPEPRVMGYIAYDKRRDRVVLFGGRRAAPDNGDLSDTWEWDGVDWKRIAGR